MTDKLIEFAIEVPIGTKRAIERAAAARSMSVSEFVEHALKKFLADAPGPTGSGIKPARD